MDEHWKKIVAKHAREVIGIEDLSEESQALLTDDISPGELIQALVASGQIYDAVLTLAHSLPRREAVWWGCMCAEEMAPVKESKSELLALAAAKKWVYEPTAERRAIAFETAQVSKTNSGGVMCALASAFSEPTLPLADGHELEVDATAFPNLVFAIAVLAASDSGQERANERLNQSLKIGIEIAHGGSGHHENVQPA